MKEKSKVLNGLIKDLINAGGDVKYDDGMLYLCGSPILLFKESLKEKYYFIEEYLFEENLVQLLPKTKSIVILHSSISDNMKFDNYINMIFLWS
mgnify:CR=1 FL=1